MFFTKVLLFLQKKLPAGLHQTEDRIGMQINPKPSKNQIIGFWRSAAEAAACKIEECRLSSWIAQYHRNLALVIDEAQRLRTLIAALVILDTFEDGSCCHSQSQGKGSNLKGAIFPQINGFQ